MIWLSFTYLFVRIHNYSMLFTTSNSINCHNLCSDYLHRFSLFQQSYPSMISLNLSPGWFIGLGSCFGRAWYIHSPKMVRGMRFECGTFPSTYIHLRSPNCNWRHDHPPRCSQRKSDCWKRNLLSGRTCGHAGHRRSFSVLLSSPKIQFSAST